MNFIGEHLLPGQIGYFLITIAFVGSLVAAISFFKANGAKNDLEKNSWYRIGKISFSVVSLSIIGIISLLIYILFNRFFEYEYAWKHSDLSLQTEYVFSALWEGQEGSFLLWAFWHAILGMIIVWRKGKWSAGVAGVISVAQVVIISMILGIYIGHFQIGNNPFILIRNSGMLDAAPMFKDAAGNLRADYLSMISDGSGLNATLQNYWMTIHPPMLFIGFASTIIPFAFAFTGLINKDHTWTKPALPWSSFSAAVLGVGIMMGAAWAYESLNFGGYWAWDPVENASLVPWLILVAGLHTNLIFVHSGYSLKSTYLFYTLSFLFILYSTYLTRSGVLGDTSVHAFTGIDINWQLLTLLLLFCIPSIALLIKRWKTIPSVKKEEQMYSREFWMFIGALVMVVGALIIIGKTSTPVFNKIFGTSIAQPEDVLFSYNQIQIFIGLIISVLTAITQYLKYKDTTPAYFGRKILWPTIISVIVSVLISIFGNIDYTTHGAGFLLAIHLALFASVYTIIANAGYLFVVLKGKIKVSGASVAHIGFGMILLGILLSSAKKEVMSVNTTFQVFEKTKDEDPAENITLFKGIPTDMGKYTVTYLNDSINDRSRKMFFHIHVEPKEGKGAFNLFPYVLRNNKGSEGFGATPNSKHYWNKDIYAYVSAFQKASADTASFRNVEMKVGDTSFYSNGIITLNKVEINAPNKNIPSLSKDELSMTLDMTVTSKSGQSYPLQPGVIVRNGNEVIPVPDTANSQGLVIRFNKVNDSNKGNLDIGIKESSTVNDFITLKVLKFPFVGVLWLGIIVMGIGFLMSVAQRLTQQNRLKKKIKSLV